MENKKFNTGIYQIVNLVNGKRYIGSASLLKKRGKQHFKQLKNNTHGNKYLQKAYNKHGKYNFKFEILLYCSREDLIFYEQRAIDAYDFKTLYNIRTKANSNLGLKASEETKKILSDLIKGKKNRFYGKKHSEETKLKMSEAKKDENISEEYKNLRKTGFRKGSKASEETKLKMSQQRKGEKCYWWGKRDGLNPLSIQVYQIDVNTNEIIKKWDSIMGIERKLNIKSSSISSVCRGKRKTAGGFKWAYVKDYENKKGE